MARGHLAVSELEVGVSGAGYDIVSDVTLEVRAGEALGVVGESGSGKTTVAYAILGYARYGTVIRAGAVRVGDVELLELGQAELRRKRGADVAYVPQDPSTALAPNVRIGPMLREMVDVHEPDERAPRDRIAAALAAAQLPVDDDFMSRYPFQLSGGQQQRVAIAAALICRPSVLVLDEPTTGLDVTTQARLLDVIRSIISDTQAAVVYVTHDLAVVRNLVDRVAVMYAGRVVELGSTESVFSRPRHPYTRRLLAAIPRLQDAGAPPHGIPGSPPEPSGRPSGCSFAPRCDLAGDECRVTTPLAEVDDDGHEVRCLRWQSASPAQPPPSVSAGLPADGAPLPRADAPASAPILEVQHLVARYGSPRRGFGARGADPEPAAVQDVSFGLQPGGCIALVGESGSGKTTTLRCLAGLHVPASGALVFSGDQLAGRARGRTAEQRRRIQLVPQNPDASLNPRHTVGQIVGRPLRQFLHLRGDAQRKRVATVLEQVQLRPSMATRLPRELSGGEKQRVAIGRAIAAEPAVLLCDEVTAALDVAVQASILELLQRLREALGMAIVFVSHDLAVVRCISTDVVVMQAGRVCEAAPTADLFSAPQHEYTRALLAAVPDFG